MRGAVAIALLTLGTGCLEKLDYFDPMTGAPQSPRCVDEDSDVGTDVSFRADILPLFKGDTPAPGCGCHIPPDAPTVGVDESGLDLSTYAGLLAGGVNSGSSIVIPKQPCQSVLWQKIAPGPPFGARMPFNGPPFLDAEARQKVADWIAEGARDN